MKTVVELTREAGGFDATPKFLERFAELIRADEREACAKVCDDNATDLSEGDWNSACNNCAAAIRARGNT